MLEEAPMLEQERQLKQRETAANTRMREAQATGEEGKNRYADRTEDQRMQLLEQQIQTAIAQGDNAKVQRLQAEWELEHKQKWGDQEAEAGLPKASESGSSEDSTPQAIFNDYDVLFGAPYEEAKRLRPELTFEDWIISAAKGTEFRQFQARVQAYNKGKPKEKQIVWGKTAYKGGQRQPVGTSTTSKRMTAEEYLNSK
jgi:hypothetical protein